MGPYYSTPGVALARGRCREKSAVRVLASLAQEDKHDRKSNIAIAVVVQGFEVKPRTSGLKLHASADPSTHLCDYVRPPISCVLHFFQNQDGSTLCSKFETSTPECSGGRRVFGCVCSVNGSEPDKGFDLKSNMHVGQLETRQIGRDKNTSKQRQEELHMPRTNGRRGLKTETRRHYYSSSVNEQRNSCVYVARMGKYMKRMHFHACVHAFHACVGAQKRSHHIQPSRGRSQKQPGGGTIRCVWGVG